MDKELLPDETPIDANPIIIDDYYSLGELEEDHLIYSNFVIEALSHQIHESRAYSAMRLSVEALINHLGLKILPPFETAMLEDGEEWGPHDPHHYFIEFEAFSKYFAQIVEHAKQSTEDPRVIEVLGYIRDRAEEELSFETDSLTLDQLAGAIYTEKYPKKHLGEGNLIAYDEFANATHHPISTSPGKVAQVFDLVASRLGDNKTKQELEKLKIYKDAFSRKYIRQSIYIKTQALADLVQELAQLPKEERIGFNDLSMQILWFVLTDEAPED